MEIKYKYINIFRTQTIMIKRYEADEEEVECKNKNNIYTLNIYVLYIYQQK